MFIGKSGAIILGYPAATQDVDIFPEKSAENGKRIENYTEAKKRMIVIEGFPVANIRDIIASKKASGRQKDLNDLPLLEDFRREFEKKMRTEISD